MSRAAAMAGGAAVLSPEVLVYPSEDPTDDCRPAGVRGLDWCVRTWLPALLRVLTMSRPAQQLAARPTPRSWDDLAVLGQQVHALDQRWAQLAPRLAALSTGLPCGGACARLRMVRGPAVTVALQDLVAYMPAGGALGGVLAAPVHHRGQQRHTGTAAARALARWETEQALRGAGAAGAAHTLAITMALGDELAHTATVLAAGSADRLEAVWQELVCDLDRRLSPRPARWGTGPV